MRRRLTYANVMSSIAVFLALATGGAYAANTIRSEDIVDGEVKAADIANGTVGNLDLAPNAVGTGKVIDNNLAAADLAPAAVGSSELAPDAVGSSEIAPDGVTGDDVDESSLGRVPEATTASSLDGSSRAQLSTDGIIDLGFACNPTSGTYANCGNPFTFQLITTSDVVVIATGGWHGSGTGADSGSCRVKLDGTFGPEHFYGQNGNEHEVSTHASALSQTMMFDPTTAGQHTVVMQCRQSDGDFVVTNGVLTIMRLGQG